LLLETDKQIETSIADLLFVNDSDEHNMRCSLSNRFYVFCE